MTNIRNPIAVVVVEAAATGFARATGNRRAVEVLSQQEAVA